METKLQVHNLRISFRTNVGKVQAVRDISFDLYKGETLAIVGESGSGKSVTSKAIIGILEGNSMIEGGEILYNGQDLLKITEEDFCKLRGDKIAMIFQDPLSSLNPIVRVGKQLTEAMLLKGKARQKSSKKSFRDKLNLLEEYMVKSDPNNANAIKENCALFRAFEMRHVKLEQAYNIAREAASAALVENENILFLIDKNAFKDAPARLKEVREFSLRAINPFVVSERADELRACVDSLKTDLSAQIKSNDFSVTADKIRLVTDILTQATGKTAPDFFAMGYYLEKGDGRQAPGTIEEQNAFYRRYLDEHFMNSSFPFFGMVQRGLTDADARYAALREKAVKALENARAQLTNGTVEAFMPSASELKRAVDESIDPFDIIKDSAACTFSGSLDGFLQTYRRGMRTNRRKTRKHDRQQRRHDALIAKGKKVDWTVAAASTVDLALVKENMLNLISNLIAHYGARAEIEKTEDKAKKAEQAIDYLRKCASGMVLRITKRAAKNKALKLMEEVGIGDARRRYRQYPFEFSGGMRQRIVIAIALAADPDILICDEPTTALDVTIQAQILELINNLKRERDLTIIFITHDLGVVANMADRIAVMYAGKIVEYGTAKEVFYQPKHPYTWALLSSMPDLDTKGKLEAIPGTPPNMIYPPVGDAFAERNRYAMKIDFERQPPAFPVSPTHWAATWLLHPDAPKVDPPEIVTDRIEKMHERMAGGSANG